MNAVIFIVFSNLSLLLSNVSKLLVLINIVFLFRNVQKLNFLLHFSIFLVEKLFFFILRSNCKSCRYQYDLIIFTVHFCICLHFGLKARIYWCLVSLFWYLLRIFLYFSKEHERNREDNFDNLDIYNNMDNPSESRSLTPYGAISGGNTGVNTAQNQIDGRSKFLLQFECFAEFNAVSANLPYFSV